MDGVFNIYKPVGRTSHEVVDYLRKVIGQKEVGHAGTLDPPAEGVLVLGVGRATRLMPYLQTLPKRYRARVRFGISTETQDATGEVVDRQPADHLNADQLGKVIPQFVGRIEQLPPLYSAVKLGGQKLYEFARQGIEVERTPRKVHIYRIELLAFEQGEFPTAELEVECGAGTYIRTLAADLGTALGVGAHVEHLLRSQVGHFRIEESVPLQRLQSREDVEAVRIQPVEAVRHLRRWSPTPKVLQQLLNGNCYQMENPLWSPGEYIVVMENEHRIALIARWLPPLLRPTRVIGA